LAEGEKVEGNIPKEESETKEVLQQADTSLKQE
jgi:hypothetical protein